MAAASQSLSAVPAKQFVHIEQQMTSILLKDDLANISRLAKDALKADPKSRFTREEREIIEILGMGARIEDIETLCMKEHFRLLPLLMKLVPAPRFGLDSPEFYNTRYRLQVDMDFRSSLGKSTKGEPEMVLPGIFLGGTSTCLKFGKGDGKKPFIISILGVEQDDHACHENGICISADDDAASIGKIVNQASGDGPIFERTFEQIDQALLEKRKVLIHCFAGQSRSVTFLAAYLIKRFGLTADQALHYVIHRRKAAVPNPAFVAFLRGLV